MSVKSFFKTSTPAQIRDLRTKELYNQRDLVDRILALNPKEEGLLLRFAIIPGQHQRRGRTHREASAKALRHGPYLKLDIPDTLAETTNKRMSPLETRKLSFGKLGDRKQNEITYVGYEFRPVQGNDRVPRRIPFARVVDAAELFAYAMTQTKDRIPVETYGSSDRVASEGAVAVVSVPSKVSGERRYEIVIRPIPTHDNNFQEAIAWSFRTQGGVVPKHKLYLFGFESDRSSAGSERIVLDDKDGAGMLAVARHYAGSEDNLVPWENNVFAKPSQLDARFNGRVKNNVLIYDPTLTGKQKYRPPHLPERSILLAKLLALRGPEESMFWQAGRDPKLIDYVWDGS